MLPQRPLVYPRTEALVSHAVFWGGTHPHPGLQDGRRHPRSGNKSVHPVPETPGDPAAARGHQRQCFCTVCFASQSCLGMWSFCRVWGGNEAPPTPTQASRMVVDIRDLQTNLFIPTQRHQRTQPQRVGSCAGRSRAFRGPPRSCTGIGHFGLFWEAFEALDLFPRISQLKMPVGS